MEDKSKEKEEEGNGAGKPPVYQERYARRRGDIHDVEESSHVWLVSFTDVMALMLTFFVLLFSMTEPAKQDWSEITAAMQAEFNKFYGAVANRGPQDSVNIAKINFNQALNLNYLEALMQTVVSDNKFLEQATLTPRRGQLIISLPHDLLFDSGQANVKEEGSRALYALGGALSRIKNQVEVVGHADPRPIDSTVAEFDSNWDLSLARSASVAGILERVGYGNSITIRGLSSGLYADLPDTMLEEDRQALARRVDIVIMDHDGSRHKIFLDKPGN